MKFLVTLEIVELASLSSASQEKLSEPREVWLPLLSYRRSLSR